MVIARGEKRKVTGHNRQDLKLVRCARQVTWVVRRRVGKGTLRKTRNRGLSCGDSERDDRISERKRGGS